MTESEFELLEVQMKPIQYKLDRGITLNRKEYNMAKKWNAALDKMAEGVHNAQNGVLKPLEKDFGVKPRSIAPGTFRGGIQGINEELGFVEPPDVLNQAERRFVLLYVQAYPTIPAYEAAFNPPEHVTTDDMWRHIKALVNQPKVQEYIADLNRRVEDMTVASKLDIERWLTEAAFTPFDEIGTDSSLCEKATVRRQYDRDGNVTSETLDRGTVSRTKAIEILSKMRGYNEPTKLDIEHKGGVMVVPMAASEEDWSRIASESQKQLMDATIDI